MRLPVFGLILESDLLALRCGGVERDAAGHKRQTQSRDSFRMQRGGFYGALERSALLSVLLVTVLFAALGQNERLIGEKNAHA